MAGGIRTWAEKDRAAMAEKARAVREKTLRRTDPRPKTKTVPATPASPTGVRVWDTKSRVLSSGVLGTKVSELDEATSKFSQVVLVEDDEAFTLKPLILTEGPFAGHRVLMLVKNVTFLDLPAEVRNQIWDLVLDRNSTFELGVRKRRDRRFPTLQGLSPTTFALARTSKRISGEVIPIVYGSNTFEFGTLAGFAHFANRIGGAARSHLRYIGIMDAGPFAAAPIRGFWDAWLITSNIQSLTLNHESLCLHALADHGKMKLADLFDRLKPLLHARYKAHKDKAGSFAALDLVKFVKHDFCSCCGYLIGEDTSNCEDRGLCDGGDRTTRQGNKHMRKVAEAWREMVAKEFGLEAYWSNCFR